MSVKVGIPSALMYYTYYPMWKTFFEELGIQVVSSGRTTKNILDNGVREALADACVPVKIFFGHVMELKDNVDFLFIPRIVCLNGKTVYCPKFLGLPDMIRHSVQNLPQVINVRMDTRKGRFSLLKAYIEIGKFFNADRGSVFIAYLKAKRKLSHYSNLLRKGLSPNEAISFLDNPKTRIKKHSVSNLKFAVLGYPYAIHDSFISVNLIEKLKRLGVSVLTAENISPLILSLQKNCDLPKRLFWTFSDLAYKAAHFLFKQGRIDGVLHLTAFGCGPDALLNKLIELEAKNHRNIPFMTLMIDEHTGEAGMATRIEAFVDMVRRRKEVQSCQN